MPINFEIVPVLVWQMGKVGSTAIATGLAKAEIPSLQIHYLSSGRLASLRIDHLERGLSPPEHTIVSESVLALLRNLDVGLRAITIVRDPVARNLSALFESWNSFPPSWNHEESIEDLNHWFMLNFDYSVLSWLEDEIGQVGGVDIYSHPFDYSNNCLTVETDRLKLLVLRAEDDDVMKQDAINRFLDCAAVKLARINDSEEKDNADLFKALRQKLWISLECAETVYRSKMMNHFYTRSEVAAFKAKWVLVPNDPDRGPTRR